MNQLRQHHFDSLRGIASVSVLMAHYLAAFYPYTIFGSRGGYLQREAWESIIFIPPFGSLVGGPLSVWLFFMLSGYVLSYGYLGEPIKVRKLLDAIIRRPIRLGGIVLFTIFLSSILWGLHLYFNDLVADLSHSKPWFASYWQGKIQLREVLVDVITAMFKKAELYNPPFWTIRIELYGSILTFILMLAIGRLKYRLLLFFAVFLALWTTGSEFARCSGLILGVIVADLVKNHNLIIKLRARRIFSFILLSTFLLFCYCDRLPDDRFTQMTIYRFVPKDSELGLYSLFAALTLFLLVIINDRLKAFLQHPLFQFLGKISYSLYAIHFLILGSMSSWLFLKITSYLPYQLSFLLVFVWSVPIIVIASILMTKYIDEPSIKAAAYVSKRVVAIGEKAIIPITHPKK